MKDLLGNPIPDPDPIRVPFRQWQMREGDVLYWSGVQGISNTHLLAHLLRDHTTAERLMAHFGDFCAIAEASMVELKRVKGVGVATAEMMQVAFELSRRLTQAKTGGKPRIYCPQDIFELLREDFRGVKQEILKVLLCDTKNQIQRIETIFIGTLNCSMIHPREVFKPAIRFSAASIILSHNHPSGVVSPSQEDIHTTRQIAKVGELVQIPVLDHLIVGDDDYFSMKEKGLI